MSEFCVDNRFCPGGWLIPVEDVEIGLNFLINVFGFPICLWVIGGGEGEVILEYMPKFFGKLGGKLRSTIRDDFCV